MLDRLRLSVPRLVVSLGGMTGFEPATPASTGRCSNQLSYIPLARPAGLEPATYGLEGRCSSFELRAPVGLYHSLFYSKIMTLRDLERMTGVEPAYSAWKADALPLSYIRAWLIILSSGL